MSVLVWLPLSVLAIPGVDTAVRLSLHLTPGTLLACGLLGLIAGWAARPWQRPVLRRQVRACGLSVGVLFLHVALDGLPDDPAVLTAELVVVCALAGLWQPGRGGRRGRGRAAAWVLRRVPPVMNRAIPLSSSLVMYGDALETSG